MYEYKFVKMGLKSAEEQMNVYAKQGWRVVSTCYNNVSGISVFVTLEREKEEY